MSNYTGHWECWVCRDMQIADETPGVRVCDDCVYRLADYLCHKESGRGLSSAGAAQGHWLREARGQIAVLFQRRRMRPTSVVAVKGSLT